MRDHSYDVYIMTNKPYGTLYVGMTSNLIGRVHEHKTSAHPKCFTHTYKLTKLVYYETFKWVHDVIAYENG